ncbi:MAG: SRPBCC family protein [Pseudomonadota bacterium]
MAEAKVVKSINAGIDAVWAALGNFAGIQAGGPIDAVSYDGEGVGMTRKLTMGGSDIVERLEVHDEASHTFTYAIINDDCPLPFADYSATVLMTDNGDGSTTVDWTGTFEPKGVPEEEAVTVATGIYAGAIKGAKLALEG